MDEQPPWWSRRMRDIELEAIQRTMADCGGNKRATAKRVKISRQTLYRKLRQIRMRVQP